MLLHKRIRGDARIECRNVVKDMILLQVAKQECLYSNMTVNETWI